MQCPPETAVNVSTALQRQKTQAMRARLVELEAATKAAAKQKAIKRQEEIARLQAECDQDLAHLVQIPDSVTRLKKSL